MARSYSANFVHIIFSTKNRRDAIPETLRTQLHVYIGGIIRKLDEEPLAVNGTGNHIHILMTHKPVNRLAESVQKIKGNSSHWLGEQGVEFAWQKGYGVFSVSASMLDTVRTYVAAQTDHHRERKYEDEFLSLLRKSGVPFDTEEVFG
jgi:REP element-mobilizing transposase RayT